MKTKDVSPQESVVPYEDLTGTIVKKICMACSREFAGTIGNCPHDGNQLVALPQDQWIGKRLADRFYIKEKLGTGGMGEVYLAWHELMERWVAIKMLKQSFIEDHQSVKRFQQEAKAASRLKHENVITLYDFGVTNTGQPYMVMDYLVGYDAAHPAMSLAQLLKEAQKSSLGGLPVETVIHIIAQACEALDHAHKQGVIHRDVKPANIMIVPKAEDPYFVKVVDFGVAKLIPINQQGEDAQSLTQVGEVCGSPVYMSPEQCMGQALDRRADIYSMGVVLYETLTGRLPLVGKNMVDTMSKHMNEAPPAIKTVRPDLFIPEKTEQVCMKALAKQPHARHQTMAELAQDLQFSIPRAGATPNLKTHELMPLPEEEKQGMPWLWPAIGGGVLVAGIGAFFALGMSQRPVTPPPRPAVITPPPAVTTPVATPAGTPSSATTGSSAATTTPASTTPKPQAQQPKIVEHHAAPVHKAVAHVAPPVHHVSEAARFDELRALKHH